MTSPDPSSDSPQAALAGCARYAVYAAPPADSPLGAFGAAWLGWSAEASAPVARLEIAGLPEPLAALTVNAARYGFHGTVKAPHHLADGATPEALFDALAAFAAARPQIPLPPLALAIDHGFVALRLSRPSAELNALAMDVVETLDAFRAPPSDAELAKRRAAGLTPRQDANLLRWGYPYVGPDFHFHLTLTKRLSPDAAAAVCAALAEPLAPILAEPWTLGDLALFGDPGAGGHFKLLARAALNG